MRTLGICLMLLSLGFLAGVNLSPVLDSPPEHKVEQCEAPISVDIEQRESYLLDQTHKWQEAFERMEDQWLTCTKDLARISDECNADIMCSPGVCEKR